MCKFSEPESGIKLCRPLKLDKIVSATKPCLTSNCVFCCCCITFKTLSTWSTANFFIEWTGVVPIFNKAKWKILQFYFVVCWNNGDRDSWSKLNDLKLDKLVRWRARKYRHQGSLLSSRFLANRKHLDLTSWHVKKVTFIVCLPHKKHDNNIANWN